MIKRIFFLIIGIILILIGIAGLFLPFLQGIITILLGLYFISKFKKIKWIDDLMNYLKNKVKDAKKSNIYNKKKFWKK
jgi:uncharacterized membrane protein YbaN (DUF454 family)